MAFRSQRRKRATSVTTEAALPQETPNIIATNRPGTTIPDFPPGVSVQLDSDREPCSLRPALVESNNALHAITNIAILFFLIVSFISLFAFSVASTDWGENKYYKAEGFDFDRGLVFPRIQVSCVCSLGQKMCAIVCHMPFKSVGVIEFLSNACVAFPHTFRCLP